jgi:hypothetical protein
MEDKAKKTDFLTEDYKQKIAYLTAHLTRMWTRFNFFIVIQTSIIGGKIFAPDGKYTDLIGWIGLGFALLGYIMGAEDRYLVELYRQQVKDVYKKIMQEENGFVGDVHDPTAKNGIGIARNTWDRFTGWRSNSFSTTRLAAIVPAIVALLWIIAIITL